MSEKLKAVFEHWSKSGKSGRSNTDSMIEAIVEELLDKPQDKGTEDRRPKGSK